MECQSHRTLNIPNILPFCDWLASTEPSVAGVGAICPSAGGTEGFSTVGEDVLGLFTLYCFVSWL